MANIGTTFTNSGKKAVLCGSGELGKEVALELQRYGVEVVALDKGKFRDAGIRKGLIITHINQTPVTTLKEVLDIIGNARRGMLIEGVYSNGDVYYYGVGV
jgi:formate-dependent phosphoribosylglycinamide formyltransferase (GAR transformylase)